MFLAQFKPTRGGKKAKVNEEIPDLFSQLHRDWVPRRGLSVDYGRPFIEIYKNDPGRTAVEDRITELLVPVGAVIQRGDLDELAA